MKTKYLVWVMIAIFIAVGVYATVRLGGNSSVWEFSVTGNNMTWVIT